MLSRARCATLVAFLAIAAMAAFAAVDRAHVGKTGATFVPSSPSSNALFTVTDAPKGDPLRRGDRILIDDPQALAAYLFHSLAAGTVLHVRRLTPSPITSIAEPIVAGESSRFVYVVLTAQMMFLVIAALVAARGTGGSLQLAWLFALIVELVNPTTSAWPRWLILAYGISGSTIAVVAFACAADFSARFTGEADASWSRRYRRLSIGFAAVAAVATVVISTVSYVFPEMPVAFGYVAFASLVIQATIFLVGLALAYFKTGDAERQKVAWVVVSLGVGVVGFVATVLLNAAGVSEPARDVPLLLLIAMPLGCAYAILRYRLLDIGFVINRATVFGVTSLLVLASLALVDFGLQNLLGSWLTRSGLYVQLGLALAIGIATRPLHGRVDRFVDDLFFRKRHEAERTLRAFVRDVAYIDDATVVRKRTVEVVANAAALRCALFLADAGRFACVESSENIFDRQVVDRNDGAIVRLRATRVPVDLHEVETAIGGDFAFPMFARNRLLGVFVCGGKIDGVAAYAPDELDAIGAVAQAAGLALDLLRTDALEAELRALRAKSERTTLAFE